MAGKKRPREKPSPNEQRSQQAKQMEKLIRDSERHGQEDKKIPNVKRPESKANKQEPRRTEDNVKNKSQQDERPPGTKQKRKEPNLNDKKQEEKPTSKDIGLTDKKEEEQQQLTAQDSNKQELNQNKKKPEEEPVIQVALEDKPIESILKPTKKDEQLPTVDVSRKGKKLSANKKPEERSISKQKSSKKDTKTKEDDEEKPRDQNVVEVEPLVIIPPDGGWGWVIVITAFVLLVCGDGTMNSFGAYSTYLVQDFQAPVATVSLVNSLATCLYYIMGPVWGALGNRYGFRLICMLGAASMAVGNFAAYLITHSLAGFGGVYAIAVGFGGGMLYMAVYVMVGIYFERWRGVAISIISCGSSVGTIIMPIAYTSIIKRASFWRYIFIFNGVLLSVCVILGTSLRPLKPTMLHPPRRDPAPPPKQKKKGTKKGKEEVATQVMASASFVTLKQAGAVASSTSLYINADLESSRDSEPRIVVRPSAFVEEDAAEGVGARPMYREDIFYAASSARLDSSQTGARISGYSVAVLPTVEDVAEERHRKKRTCAGDCTCCPPAVRRVLANFLDANLLKSPVFLGLVLTQTVCMIGYHAPFLYLLARAEERGMGSDLRYWLLPTVGITNTIGRMLCGFVVEVPHISALHLTNVSYMIGGLFTICSSLSHNAVFQFVYVAVFGFMAAAFMSMKSIILVDYLGIERLTNAFGLLLMFQGFAALIGPSIAGFTAIAAQNLDYAFYVSGIFCVIGALLGYLLNPLKKMEEKRKRARPLLPNSD